MRTPTDLVATFARAAALAVPVALAACASKPVEPPPPPPAPAPVAAAPAPVAAPAPAPARAPAALAAYLDPNNPISQKRSVYYDFNDATFHADDKAVIELQGSYLAKHADLHVHVEGNTDERGGSEYNLALGQRRADAVKSALKVFGVKDDQVETVSYGKEHPKATGHDEESWAQNRRSDIVYPSN